MYMSYMCISLYICLCMCTQSLLLLLPLQTLFPSTPCLQYLHRPISIILCHHIWPDYLTRCCSIPCVTNSFMHFLLCVNFLLEKSCMSFNIHKVGKILFFVALLMVSCELYKSALNSSSCFVLHSMGHSIVFLPPAKCSHT